MTRFSATALDLSNLPAPEVVSVLDHAVILAARRAALVAAFEARGIAYDVADLETDGAVINEEVDAYREVLVRARINDAAKATMLAFATGSDLEHIGALYGVARRPITAATSTTAAVHESDAELRRRIQLAPEALTTCGSEAAYVFHALEAAPALIDARPIVGTTASGQVQVRIVCLDRGASAVPTAATLEAVRARVDRTDVRPMTVPVSVCGPTVVHYGVTAVLKIASGPDPELVRNAALAAVTTMVAARRGLGVDLLRQAIEAAARVSGVERVVLTSPAADRVIADDQVALCDVITITTEGVDD